MNVLTPNLHCFEKSSLKFAKTIQQFLGSVVCAIFYMKKYIHVVCTCMLSEASRLLLSHPLHCSHMVVTQLH